MTHKIRVTFLALTSYFLVSAGVAFSATPYLQNASGTISHGNSITISGSNFGSHVNNNEGSFAWNGSSPICAKFKDFEDNSIKSKGFFVENGFDNEWHTSSSNKRNNSNYYGTRKYVSSRLAHLKYNQSSKSTGKLYCSFYFMVGGALDGGKPWRWYYGDDSSKDNLYLTSTYGGYLGSHSEASNTGGDGLSVTPNVGQWYRIDIFADKDTHVFRAWINGVLRTEQYDYFDKGVFNAAGHGVQWGYISNMGYGTWNYDDLYVDYTQARVELGNSSNWSSCTHREVQIPTSWTSNSINIKVNRGAFTQGETAFLYVIDSYGNVSNPLQVEIGGSVVANNADPVAEPDPTVGSDTSGGSGTTVGSDTSGGSDSSVWNSAVNIGDNSWSDSSVTYCVRLLIPGDQITKSGNTIKLGFQGRSAGQYTIKNVSIAERDTTGSQGDIIDSSWTKITFDNKGESWWDNNNVIVPQGTEKVSNATNFELQMGKDYYITFKVESPSVYLDPPSGYQELIFNNNDHSQDLDWSGLGFNITRDFHALANIYITTDPSSPKNLRVTAIK